MCRGLRHGYGVRKSAPYGDSQLNNPNKSGQFNSLLAGAGSGSFSLNTTTSSMLIHSNSLQSTSAGSIDLQDDSPKPEDGFKPNIDRTLASKNGFVLVAKPLDVPISSSSSSSKYNSNNINGDSKLGGNSRRSSLTNKLASARIPGSNQTASLLRGLRLRKQKSSSDLDALSNHHSSSSGKADARSSSRATGGAGNHSPSDDLINANIPFTLSPEELDITDPTTVETYTGEWKHDKRNGHGVCDRSDGLKYEGQWHNDMKCGYGVTTFKNGTKEEGKYKNNILIVDSKVKRFFQLGSANIRQRIDEAVKMAQQAQTMALKKAEIADTRAATARDKAEQAGTAAFEAARDSQIAYSVARQYSNNSDNLATAVGLPTGNSFSLLGGNQMMQQVGGNFMMMSGGGGDNLGMTSLNMSMNPLQMRRISQHQHQLNQQTSTATGGGGGGSSYQDMGQYHDQSMQMQMHQDQRLQGEMDHHNQQQQHQAYQQRQQPQQQHNDNQSYLGPEPFNGRRGSFRGGSSIGGGGSMVGGGQSRVNFSQYQQQQYQQLSRHQSHSGQLGGGGRQNTHTSDPFNDLFDHYKSNQINSTYNSIGNNMNSARFSRRMPMIRQTSLDAQNTATGGRAPSVPRQMGSTTFGGRNDRMRSFRMSSMDHAEENHHSRQQPQSISAHDLQVAATSASRSSSAMSRDHEQHQQQLKRLVTSGEELQRQAAAAAAAAAPTNESNNVINPNQPLETQLDGATGGPTASATANSTLNTNHIQQQQQTGQMRGATPTSSASYIQPPQSTGSSIGFGTNLSQPTPSPDGGQSSGVGGGYSVGGVSVNQYSTTDGGGYQDTGNQQAGQSMASYQTRNAGGGGFPYQRQQPFGGYMMRQNQQRDVHSLADEQLYINTGRRQQVLDRTEFSNYDFTISSGPRPAQRCIRRTASLSRHSPAKMTTAGHSTSSRLGDFRSHSNMGSTLNTVIGGGTPTNLLQRRGLSPTPNQGPMMRPTEIQIQSYDEMVSSGGSGAGGQQQQQQQMMMDHLSNINSGSRLTLDSAGSSGPLLRKPSLQVRYDPVALGGLMSREEVAALSHAQREQKRIELELAERRAKRPLLHLYLSLREFISNQRLMLTVIVINLFLMKMFADLIS